MSNPIDRLSDALSDRYRIERELGAGGMATVFLAHDIKHNRNVAVKVLRPELAAILGAERFLKEIEVTANLQHPHILPLFDSGEADSFLYYVMPFVEGESLREKLNREKQLAIDEAVRIATEVASALDYAHRQDVIHRDIKPENILLQDGHAAVADFGIALAVSDVGAERLTETGISLGTPEYMSPEQATASRQLDARSDIYALGCVVFEMLTGEPPYSGATAQAILTKCLRDPVPSARRVRDMVSPTVDAALARALAKTPADRFRRATDLAEALSAPKADVEAAARNAGAAVALTDPDEDPRKSIVVLPFDNLSPDPNDSYFSDGLTEEIITRLSHLNSLRVISRRSAMALKGTQKDVRTIGRELEVEYVLEGSVRKAGNNLRITAQLIDARADAHLWAEQYDGTLDDIFSIQEEASQAIVDALDLKINPREREKLVERPIEDLRAYECYLRARNDIHKGTAESLSSALRHLEVGLEILGENELLYQGMAELHLQNYEYGVKADEETLREAEKFAARVMALRPDSANGHYLKGRIERFRGSCQTAARHLARALAIDPNHPGALSFLVAAYALQMGKPSAAEDLAKRLIAIDPLSPLTVAIIGWHEWLAGRADEALSTFERVLELEPDFVFAHVQGTAYVLMWQDRREEALDVLTPIARRDPRDFFADWAILLQCALAGDSAGAERALSENSRAYFWNDPEAPWFMASAYALAGAKEQALRWLERAVDRGWINYPLFSHQDPLLESIRGEERFQNLMHKVEAAWNAFEVPLVQG